MKSASFTKDSFPVQTPGSVHVLKVVDEFHKKNKLKKHTTHGQVISLTSNTITIKNKKGKTATYPITGTKQYYQNGIKAGDWVYLTFKGEFPDTSDDSSASLNASHLKVLSISDLKDCTDTGSDSNSGT